MGRLIDEDSLKFTNFEIVMCEGDFKKAFKLLCEKLDNAPTVDAEPVRHGHWVIQWNRYDKDGYVIQTIGRCSCCNQYSDVLDYCGNCGAKMDGEE